MPTDLKHNGQEALTTYGGGGRERVINTYSHAPHKGILVN